MSVHFFYAQNNIPAKETQLGFSQLDFLPIKMPNDEKNMDFTGIHYNLKLSNKFYAGAGFYGAVNGIRGGFFTLGVNAGFQQNIIDNFFIDLGIHFGGGGGASAPDGGGAFVLPHLSLGYQLKKIALTAGWSYVNFFDGGEIKSNQLYASIQVPLSLHLTSFKNKELSFSADELLNTKWKELSSRISFMIHANNLALKGDSQFNNADNTNIAGRTMRLAGFEVDGYVYKKIFAFLKADGAYAGIPAGYMDIFIGGGYHVSMNKNRTNILAKFGIGAGGGGGVDTKGGFLIYPDLSLEQKLFDNVYASINKGFLMSPDSHFYSSTLGFGLKYYLDKDGITSNENAFTLGKFKGFETILKQELYFNAHRNGGFQQNMHQIAVQFNLFLNKYVFVAGQTAFANFGNAGAYAEGIVGVGFQSNSFFKDNVSAFMQILGGAAGGGGLSTGEGLIVKPSIGVNLNLNKKIYFRSALGYVKAKEGNLSSLFINLGINYRFAYLSAK